jgi:hypothetical protein
MQQSKFLQDFILLRQKCIYIYIYNKINIHYLETTKREEKQVKKRVTPEFGGYYNRNFIPQIQGVTIMVLGCRRIWWEVLLGQMRIQVTILLKKLCVGLSGWIRGSFSGMRGLSGDVDEPSVVVFGPSIAVCGWSDWVV